jgi:hypothetical protein
MNHLSQLFQQLVTPFSIAFVSRPTIDSFFTITLGWILCTGRRTITGIIRAAGPDATKSHDAYQRFFSGAKWQMDELWKVLFFMIIKLLPDQQSILIVGDDTLLKHYGRKIWGAGLYRDAVRSSKKYPCYAWGLNWVVLAIIVELPLLNNHLIALPVLARLNPKKTHAKKKGKGSKQKNTTVSLMKEMLQTVADWLPERQFVFCGDGAYASVAKHLPKNMHLVSRIRKDAAIYSCSIKKTNKKGRPRKKGIRLPAPKDMASSRKKKWQVVELNLYGKTVQRHLFQFQAIWHEVCPNRPINIVIVRDPEGRVDDEFFFSTNITLSAIQIVHVYTGRWPIEVVFRESKQYFGIADSQARKKQAVIRTTPFCLWLISLIKLWFILERKCGSVELPEPDPWYTNKSTVSFQDMLAALRRSFWCKLFSTMSSSEDELAKINLYAINSLSEVA